MDFDVFAEATRFELVVRLPVRQFSKLVVSATHPNFLAFAFAGANIGRNFRLSKLFFQFTVANWRATIIDN